MTRLVMATNEGLVQKNISKILKENLIVFDPDLIDDYPLEQSIDIMLPGNYKVVFAKNLPHDELVTVLQRAKVMQYKISGIPHNVLVGCN